MESDRLIDIIRNIVIEILKKYTRNQPTCWNVKVIPSSGTIATNGTASVFVDGDTTVSITLKNKTWESLTANNECIAFSPTSNLSNAVILYKK